MRAWRDEPRRSMPRGLHGMPGMGGEEGFDAGSHPGTGPSGPHSRGRGAEGGSCFPRNAAAEVGGRPGLAERVARASCPCRGSLTTLSGELAAGPCLSSARVIL